MNLAHSTEVAAWGRTAMLALATGEWLHILLELSDIHRVLCSPFVQGLTER